MHTPLFKGRLDHGTSDTIMAFMHDMSRLSLNVDLTYISIEDRNISLEHIAAVSPIVF